MKEIIGKARKTQPLLPRKVILSKIEINEEKRIANKFINFFIDIGPELAKEILALAKSFEIYVPKSTTAMSTGPISVNRFSQERQISALGMMKSASM